jgi:membrane dipeptidase
MPQVMSVISGFRKTIGSSPDKYVLAVSLHDVEHAATTRKIAIGFDLEGAMPLLEQPDTVALYADLGVRQMHLAYNRNNSVAGGCHDVEQGLTPLGHEVVDAINAAGVLMDCSHTDRHSSLDIMPASSKPVIFSHSNPHARVDHGCNVTDEDSRLPGHRRRDVCVGRVAVSGQAAAHRAGRGASCRLCGRSGRYRAYRFRSGYLPSAKRAGRYAAGRP